MLHFKIQRCPMTATWQFALHGCLLLVFLHMHECDLSPRVTLSYIDLHYLINMNLCTGLGWRISCSSLQRFFFSWYKNAFLIISVYSSGHEEMIKYSWKVINGLFTLILKETAFTQAKKENDNKLLIENIQVINKH